MKCPITISAFLLVASTSLCAADPDAESMDRESAQHEWQSVNGDMTASEYRQAYRHNQRMVRDFVKNYSESTLTSMGVPKTGVKVLGAAAGLAAGKDARLYLNDSKIMALELRDATEDDRALFFGISLDW
jgi:hypothetical protein